MRSQLPPDLRHYLEQYPQPAFVLCASVLREVLVDRPARLAAQSGNLSGSSGQGSQTGRLAPGSSASGDPSSTAKESELTSRQLYEGEVTEEERCERAEDEREAALKAERAAALPHGEPERCCPKYVRRQYADATAPIGAWPLRRSVDRIDSGIPSS